MNDEAVNRTAPVTPGLLNIFSCLGVRCYQQLSQYKELSLNLYSVNLLAPIFTRPVTNFHETLNFPK